MQHERAPAGSSALARSHRDGGRRDRRWPRRRRRWNDTDGSRGHRRGRGRVSARWAERLAAASADGGSAPRATETSAGRGEGRAAVASDEGRRRSQSATTPASTRAATPPNPMAAARAAVWERGAATVGGSGVRAGRVGPVAARDGSVTGPAGPVTAGRVFGETAVVAGSVAAVDSDGGGQGGQRLRGRVLVKRGLEGRHERGGRGPAVLRLLGQRLQDRSHERLLHLRGRRKRDRILHVLHQHGHGRVGGEGHAAGQELVGHDAEGIDVRAPVHGRARGLLGGHVLRGAADHPGRGELVRAIQHPRDAEVGEVDALVLVEQDVLGLHVAVDDALGVGVGEGIRGRPSEWPRRAPAPGAHASRGSRARPRGRGAWPSRGCPSRCRRRRWGRCSGARGGPPPWPRGGSARRRSRRAGTPGAGP